MINKAPNNNGSFSVKDDEIVLCEGQITQAINILLQGKVDVYISTLDEPNTKKNTDILKHSFRLFNIEQNIFIGANDLLVSKKNSYTYRASDDSSLYAIPAHTTDQLKTILTTQKDYAAHIITSISTLIQNSDQAFNKIRHFLRELEQIADNLVTFFWFLRERYSFSCAPSSRFFRDGLENLGRMKEKNIPVPNVFDIEFIKKDFSEVYETECLSIADTNREKIEYYKHLSSIPLDLRKAFFGADTHVAMYNCLYASELLDDIQSNIKDALKAANACIKKLYTDHEESIFSEYIRAATEISKSSSDPQAIMDTINFIIKKLKEVTIMYEMDYNNEIDIDIEYIDNMYNHVKSCFERGSSCNDNDIAVNGESDNIPEELLDSARKILEYADLPKDKYDLFWSNLEAFRNLNDKFRLDNDANRIRSAVTSVFFQIYESVFKKVQAENNTSKLLHMFLNFSYMDERLLKTPQTLALYKLVDKYNNYNNEHVFSMYNWLVKIYNLEKDPSLNEFGQDYYDVFREMKRRGEVSDREKAEYESNRDARLSHEIYNMFRINHKLCQGQISVYFPIIHSDMITRDLWKSLVTSDILDSSISKILEVDFSAFHREVSYRNADKGIEKEFVMKSVLPDIILMPTLGTRALMWQEITGRSRSTPGRFIFPSFTIEDIDELMIKLVGNFRWELCRTMMGAAWNDVSQKSLTSEYTDYIQFFKKNKDLTDDAKEKLKVQIAKYRNKLRDIFTSDYELWINYESKGSIRLNKVVRGILYRNCPFTKSIRDNVAKQPLFSEFSTQFNILRAKQAREFENRYAKLVKSGISLDSELEDNLRFYKDM